ncbi:MAG: CDP-alcohol phosphatidyltransferase family protein [Rhodovibrionaceae bacterium]|nr:CDP-alcohol phosphatidyltransferase family protein [Rhodovibrionaceae bacterium]
MNDTTATRDQAPETQAAADDSAICPIAFILGDSDRRFWGLGTIERLRNSLARVGVTDHRLVETSDGIDMSDLPDDGKVMLLRGDHIYEERLLKALARHRDIMLILPGADDRPRAAGAVVPAAQARWAAECVAPSAEIDAHALPPGMRAMDPAQAASSFDNQLRKRAAPYVFDTLRHRQEEIEKRMFQGAYKGVTDLVTKWLWPWPARHVTRWLAPTPVTPNMVTALSLVFVFVAMYFFGQGWFLWGVAAAWFMTFLDTVDGKLARVTLTSSKWGNVFDHGIDLIHPPFWWAAWYYGCLAMGTAVSGDLLFAALLVNLVGYVAGRLEEGLFIWRFGIELHSWRRVDSLFRQITARRNPNLLLLTAGALVGYPGEAFVAVAAWTAISLAFHAVRIGQAVWLARQGRTIRSWLSEPAGKTAA